MSESEDHPGLTQEQLAALRSIESRLRGVHLVSKVGGALGGELSAGRPDVPVWAYPAHDAKALALLAPLRFGVRLHGSDLVRVDSLESWAETIGTDRIGAVRYFALARDAQALGWDPAERLHVEQRSPSEYVPSVMLELMKDRPVD